MSFGKPFRAKPVTLGAYARADEERRLRRIRIKRRWSAAGFGVGVFVIGMAITNWDSLPTFYPSCAWARTFDAAPIHRGEPGYRSGLDADNDGVACEPYRVG